MFAWEHRQSLPFQHNHRVRIWSSAILSRPFFFERSQPRVDTRCCVAPDRSGGLTGWKPAPHRLVRHSFYKLRCSSNPGNATIHERVDSTLCVPSSRMVCPSGLHRKRTIHRAGGQRCPEMIRMEHRLRRVCSLWDGQKQPMSAEPCPYVTLRVITAVEPNKRTYFRMWSGSTADSGWASLHAGHGLISRPWYGLFSPPPPTRDLVSCTLFGGLKWLRVKVGVARPSRWRRS